MPTEEEILEKKEKAKKGWRVFKVDLEYPQELHKEHNSFPLAPEKKAVQGEWLSSYQKED